MSISIARGPKSAAYWSGIGFNGQIIELPDAIGFRGDINYGRGGSDVEFRIRPEDFANLAKAMMRVDRNEAIKAFGQALCESTE